MKAVQHILTASFLIASTVAFAQQSDTTRAEINVKAKPSRTVERIADDLHIYVGFNNVGGSVPADYEFRPVGSRFVALSWQYRVPLAVKGSTKLRLFTGPEVAWNNFMFDGQNKLVERDNQLVVEPAAEELKKSKLTTAQLNLPVILNVTFRSGLSLGVGAYAGLRLDSYTKVKPVSGSAVRTHGSYNLNPLRWGLTTELGFCRHTRLFVRYEPNSLFRAGEGPDMNVWSAGIKL
ncbi:hypothetical protein BN8_04895 [Fibrisoma limi BUZ 3]|uniref:Outer membrane protein beta-barrel domain-containing protein n=1 Tax=Fibrisoma limi BUZ 3 TaxID=1185876 RepID=I2GNZ6_9BACT|nr:outer membrane beta-barrel protein [Fibrisoma limi]CCH55624.1 hypothetical protein BN8_04895 [Fibrisoma limi BUZ 3]